MTRFTSETAAAFGGKGGKAKRHAAPFALEELSTLRTVEDCKRALDQVRVAVLTRRITPAEGNSASRALDAWTKAEGAAVTARLVGELRAELASKAAEIAELRKALAAGPRRVVG